MSKDNGVLVAALKEASTGLGFKGIRGVNYYRNQPETACVLNLQRSSFGAQFYVNAGVFLMRFGDVQRPKEYACHIRWRLTSLMSEEERSLFETALDMESDLGVQSRTEIVVAGVKRHGFQWLAECVTEQASLNIAGRINAGVTRLALN